MTEWNPIKTPPERLGLNHLYLVWGRYPDIEGMPDFPYIASFYDGEWRTDGDVLVARFWAEITLPLDGNGDADLPT